MLKVYDFMVENFNPPSPQLQHQVVLLFILSEG